METLKMAMENKRQVEYLKEEQDYFCWGISEEAILSQRVFTRGEGPYLIDLDGNRYLDFTAGIFTNSLGHGHPHVVDEMKEQIDTLWNVHDFASAHRLSLCKLLREFFPDELNTYCFFTTGSEAVEAALRAIYAVSPPERQRIGALRNGFHGKTMGARMLVHWDVGYTNFSGNSILGYSAYCYRCPFEMSYPTCNLLCARLLVRHICHKTTTAALIFEPILGAGGVIVPPSAYWELIQEECKKNHILMVADEILVGGGRTGKFLTCEHFGLEPDLVTIAKGLSSGFPFSVLAGKKEIINSSKFAASGSASATFSSSPLSIRAAKATLEVIKKEKVIENVQNLSNHFYGRLLEIKARHKTLGDVRGMGFLFGLEFVENLTSKTPCSKIAQAVFRFCFDNGLKTCIGGHIIRLGPPLTINRFILNEALDVIDAAITRAEKELD
jgi:4-aminobutyrate aminotransferase-like enzyme